MSLTTLLPIAISIVALLLPSILKSDGWPDYVNGLISGGVVAVFAALAVWAGGAFSPDVLADWALFVAAYGALLSGPLKPLDHYLQSTLFLPFLKPRPANPHPVTSLGTKAMVPPQPIILPPGSMPVPPRASQGQVSPVLRPGPPAASGEQEAST